jgi:hypothetical protein
MTQYVSVNGYKLAFSKIATIIVTSPQTTAEVVRDARKVFKDSPWAFWAFSPAF